MRCVFVLVGMLAMATITVIFATSVVVNLCTFAAGVCVVCMLLFERRDKEHVALKHAFHSNATCVATLCPSANTCNTIFMEDNYGYLLQVTIPSGQPMSP